MFLGLDLVYLSCYFTVLFVSVIRVINSCYAWKYTLCLVLGLICIYTHTHTTHRAITLEKTVLSTGASTLAL